MKGELCEGRADELLRAGFETMYASCVVERSHERATALENRLPRWHEVMSGWAISSKRRGALGPLFL